MRILHRDRDIVVVQKPSGLLTHRSELAPDSDVVMTRVRDAIGQRVFPLHRLDRGTSGALAFALNEAAAQRLGASFAGGGVKKTYLALVRGRAPDHVVLDYAIPRGEGKERVAAVTAFWLLYAGSFFSLVTAEPKTGRYHQVRRHLSHLRHPIACDSNYGTGWFNRKIRAEAGLERLALHALRLELPAPDGRIEVHAPLPRDFADALARLGVPHEIVS